MSWREVEIGNLVELRQGLCINKKSNHLVAETGLPLLRITDMINNKHSVFIKEEVPEKYIAKYEDIIYSRTGQVGLVFRHQFGVLFNNCFTVAPISDELSRDYLYWFLRCDETKKMANDYASGAAQLDLSHSAFKCIKIKYPAELPTQRKIASFLSAYDDLIENNLKRIKLLEEKLMIEYSLLEEESKNLNEIDFSNFVTFVKGIEPGSSNYLSEKSDGTLPFIRVGDLSKRDSDIFVEESKSKGIICNPNDVLISMDGTIGIVKYGIYGCYSSGIRKAVSNGDLNNAFIFCYLSSKKIQGVIYSHSKGSTIQHAGSSINHFKIKLPKEKSLNDFIRFSNPIYDLMNNLLKQNTKLREARDILLPKLMNGQIEV